MAVLVQERLILQHVDKITSRCTKKSTIKGYQNSVKWSPNQSLPSESKIKKNISLLFLAQHRLVPDWADVKVDASLCSTDRVYVCKYKLSVMAELVQEKEQLYHCDCVPYQQTSSL